MNQSQLLKPLSVVFQIVGAVMLLTAAGTIFSNWQMLHIEPEALRLMSTERFDFVSAMFFLFGIIGHAFFAFLAAFVFRMLAEGKPIGEGVANRCALVASFAYVGEGIFLICDTLTSTSTWLRSVGSMDAIVFLGVAMRFLPLFVPFLYAISLLVLWRHFSQLVTFQSEVA